MHYPKAPVEQNNSSKDIGLPPLAPSSSKNELHTKTGPSNVNDNDNNSKPPAHKFEIEQPDIYTDQIPSTRRNIIFIMFLLSNLFLNYDTGVIPASLLEIVKEINFDYKEQALLGSLVYLGLSFASLFVSIIFSRFSPSKVCAIILLLNTLCCFTFSLSMNKTILFTMRFFMGVTEAFIVIYGPVWVNNYSPFQHQAKWMGILHSCSVLGVVLGYIVAGIVINFFSKYLTWRFAIQIQGFVEIIFSLFFFFERDEFINVDVTRPAQMYEESLENENESGSYSINYVSRKKAGVGSVSFRGHLSGERSRRESRIDSIETSNLGRYCYQTKLVLMTPLYLTITFGLCSIYFIVTGIQFWMTAYLIGIVGIDPITVVALFSLTSITAPLLGVLMGGVFVDSYGGYKGKNSVKAMKLCCAFGFVSFVFAFPLGFLFSLTYVITLLWFFLFFGAAIIPVGTGIMISSVRKDCQAMSSSLSQLTFNLFGYFFAPILTGFIMDSFKDKKQGFIWGMRVIFWWVIFSLIFMVLSYVLVYKKYKSKTAGDENDLYDENMEGEMAEFMKLEINRRLAQASV